MEQNKQTLSLKTGRRQYEPKWGKVNSVSLGTKCYSVVFISGCKLTYPDNTSLQLDLNTHYWHLYAKSYKQAVLILATTYLSL